jgi:hypothetical protein
MSAECENLAKCPFFDQFQNNSEVVKNGWVRMYCQSQEKSEQCVRKQHRRRTGTPPPPNMTPTGKML